MRIEMHLQEYKFDTGEERVLFARRREVACLQTTERLDEQMLYTTLGRFGCCMACVASAWLANGHNPTAVANRF